MMRWVVVGIGDITSKRVIPAIQAEPRSELYGVVTRSPEKAAGYGCRVWTSLGEALGDGAIDAVYVASPVFLHAEQTIAALRAGKHVLCEKPMAMHYMEARRMEAVASETGRTLGVAYFRRMYPKIRKALELVREGAIGRPVLAEINCHSWFAVVNGFRAWLVEPEKSGGGPLFDIGSHRIDLLNYFFGKPVRVSGHLSNVVHQWRVEGAATVLIEYETQVRGVVDLRWHSRVHREEFRITGTDGVLDLSPVNEGALTWPGGQADIPCHPNVHYPCIENFVDAVHGKAELAASGTSSLWTDWITEQVMAANPGEAGVQSGVAG